MNQKYRESRYGFWALRPGTRGRTEDNHLLFSAVGVLLDPETSEKWFTEMAKACEIVDGCLLRFPNAQDVTSWDDHLAVAVMSPRMAEKIFMYGVRHDWDWPSGLLGRFGLLVPTLKVCAGVKLSWISQVQVFGAYIWDCFWSAEETSGRQLCWLAAKRLKGQGQVIDLGLLIWAARMKQLFGTMKEVFRIYYGKTDPGHPYIEAVQDDFI